MLYNDNTYQFKIIRKIVRKIMKIPAEISGLRLVVLFHSSMAARSAAPWFGSKSHSTAFLDTFFNFPFHTINVAGVALVHTLARVYLLSVYQFYYLFLSIIHNVRFTFSSFGIVSEYSFDVVRENLMWCGIIAVLHQKPGRLHRSYHSLQ